MISKRIAVIGGTGAQGSGLALRWAHAGHHVTIGSRSADKAADIASRLNVVLGREVLFGVDCTRALERAEIAVITVPYSAQISTLKELKPLLAGKIVIDVTVPLVPPRVSRVQLPADRSAALAAQQMLGEGIRVIAAFQNVSAHNLGKLDHTIGCDVLVCGDDSEAREVVVQLAKDAGLRGFHAGPLENAIAVESLTPLLIFMNRFYKVPAAGIEISGIAVPVGE